MNELTFNVEPGFAAGHVFTWALDPAFLVQGALHFTVQRGETHEGPWTDVSPVLTDVYQWQADKLVASKDPTLYYRLRMVAPGHVEPIYSCMRMPYGDLGRREFLLVADMMRRELLQMQQMAGVPGVVFVKSVFGPRCTACRDWVTGDVLKQDCSNCFGTGRAPGYHGPYPTWMTFSPKRRNKGMQPDQTTTREPYTHQVRMLGSPRVKKDDILVDVRQDKRYYVDTVVNLTELRRVPVVQDVTANEIPNSSPVYRLGTE